MSVISGYAFYQKKETESMRKRAEQIMKDAEYRTIDLQKENQRLKDSLQVLKINSSR